MVSARLFTAAAATPVATAPGRLCGYYVSRLGAAAPWLLKPEVIGRALEHGQVADEGFAGYLEAFAERKAHVPTNPGTCVVAFVLGQDVPEDGLIRQAFFLPFQWVRTPTFSARLPQGEDAGSRSLRDVAIDARNVFADGEGENGLPPAKDFALDLAPCLADVSLSGLPVAAESGWASLAAGLRLAQYNARPKATVMASGAWQPETQRVAEVGGLAAKIALAREFHCEVFYAAAFDIQQKELGALASQLEVRFFDPNARNGREALGRLLQEYELPPRKAEGATLEQRCAYANRQTDVQPTSRHERERYVLEEITADLAEELPGVPRDRIYRRLALIMSSPPATLLTLLAFRYEEALVLYTQRTAADSEARGSIKEHLRRRGISRVDFREVRYVNQRGKGVCLDDLEAVVSAFFGDAGTDARCAFDVTGGTKGMTAAAADVAARHNADVFHIDAEHWGYQSRIGTEFVHFVRRAS